MDCWAVEELSRIWLNECNIHGGGGGLSCSQAARAIREATPNATEEAFSNLRTAGKERRPTLWNPRVEVICTRDREK